MKIERVKNTSRNVLFGMILRVYQVFLPFLMRTVLRYYLGVEYLGLNSLFSSVLQVLNLAELGVGAAMVFSMYKPIAEDDHETICRLMYLYRKYYRIIGAVIAVVGAALTPFVPRIIKSDLPQGLNVYVLYLMNLSITVLSYWLFAYKNCLIQAHQRVDVTSVITIAVNTVQYLAQIVVLRIFHNYYYFFTCALISQIVNNIVTAIASNKMYPDYHPLKDVSLELNESVNKRVKDLFTSKVGNVIGDATDTIIISSFLGLLYLGIYHNYFYIVTAVSGFLTVLFNAVRAGMGNSLIVEDEQKNLLIFRQFTFIISSVLCFCTTEMLVLCQPFMRLWMGDKMTLPLPYALLFTLYFYIYNFTRIFSTVKDAAGMWHEDRFRPLIGAVTNLTLNIVSVRIIGLYGILISTIAVYAFIFTPWLISNVFKYIYKGNAKVYMRDIALYVVVLLLSCSTAYIVCNLIPFTGIIELASKAIAGALASLVIQLLLLHRTNVFKVSYPFVKRFIKKFGNR